MYHECENVWEDNFIFQSFDQYARRCWLHEASHIFKAKYMRASRF